MPEMLGNVWSHTSQQHGSCKARIKAAWQQCEGQATARVVVHIGVKKIAPT
jgi:phage-related minor tail protein